MAMKGDGKDMAVWGHKMRLSRRGRPMWPGIRRKV